MQTVLKKLWIGSKFGLYDSFFGFAISLLRDDHIFLHCSPYRFSQFFTKPLMSSDATLREIKAVDSGK